MRVTKKEASNMWCPFVRALPHREASVAINRLADGAVPHSAVCIGPNCLAWRSGSPKPPNFEPTGYCGLAGVPKDE